jgi:4-diphosphocytidyl-2-C-methyl-D-erythritol kinase
LNRWVVRCPAKVNLGLRIVGRRSDGYHDLETTFQAIELWDTMTLAPAERLELTTDHARLEVGEDNLVVRAARQLDPERGAAIHLRKGIPIQGGLGGGSSDAAGALLGLCRLWDVDPGPQALAAAAAELGADVPFFLVGGRALGRGRGDRIEPLADPAALALVLGTPPFGVSTAWAFEAWDERLTAGMNDVSLSPLFAHKSGDAAVPRRAVRRRRAARSPVGERLYRVRHLRRGRGGDRGGGGAVAGLPRMGDPMHPHDRRRRHGPAGGSREP